MTLVPNMTTPVVTREVASFQQTHTVVLNKTQVSDSGPFCPLVLKYSYRDFYVRKVSCMAACQNELEKDQSNFCRYCMVCEYNRRMASLKNTMYALPSCSSKV